eukprot:9170625-Prorocentrum_lima.AAC.1
MQGLRAQAAKGSVARNAQPAERSPGSLVPCDAGGGAGADRGAAPDREAGAAAGPPGRPFWGVWRRHCRSCWYRPWIEKIRWQWAAGQR